MSIGQSNMYIISHEMSNTKTANNTTEIIKERFCLFFKHCSPYQIGKVVVISKIKEWLKMTP